MMIEKLTEILKASSADDWQITDTAEEGWEFYFIAHKLDQNRVKNTDHVSLTVYKRSEDGQYIGSASSEVRQGSSEEEMKKLVDTLCERAQLVRNRNYELHTFRKAEPFENKTASIAETAADYISMMEEIRETPAEDINSHEIFVSRKDEHLISSKGIDLRQSFMTSMMEAVINARDEQHEIELYRMYRSGTCDKEQIAEDIYETMRCGHDRLRALKTPNLVKCPVVFRGESALTLAGYFLDKIDAAMVYRGMSSWKKGEPYAEDIKGDRVTLKALRYLENSPSNRAYDAEGGVIRDLTLIEEGVVREYTGNRMFSSYIGSEDSYIVSNWEVSGGTMSEAEIRSGSYLEAAEFSDFQADPLTGDFFGEIRLAWYHDGRNTIPVSGGSVSGNLNELVKEMRMSREMNTRGSARVPALIRLEGVTVTGSED
jgi:PmbA protein